MVQETSYYWLFHFAIMYNETDIKFIKELYSYPNLDVTVKVRFLLYICKTLILNDSFADKF